MKLRVVRCDGSQEVIDLVGPCLVQHGEFLHRVQSSSGMEHFFTHDGAYDGWGMATPPDCDAEAAREIIEDVERHRHIEQP